MIAVETLYKTKTPDLSTAEYYELILKSDGDGYRFTEKYGWWDDVAKQRRNDYTTFSPEDPFVTIEEARVRYNQQRLYRAKNGFVHALSPDPYGDKPYNYELIEVEQD